MANKIQVKRSAVAAKVPTTGDLDLGEIAINTYDGKMYIKKDDGTASIVQIGAGGSGSGDVVGPASATDNAITRYDGTTGKLIQNSTITLDDNGNIINANSLGFDTTPATVPATVGTMSWDDGDGVPSVLLKGGTSTLQVGTQEYARVYNDSGTTLTIGQVVYISGAQGNRVAVKLARADVEATSFGTIGVVSETIANGAEGFILVSGALYKLNTIGLVAGATVYLSPTTAGAVTTTKPQAPDQLVVIGWVERVNATVGSIYVKIDNGYELDELHDVKINTPTNGNTLIYNNTLGVWVNSDITASTGISIANGAGSITVTNVGVTNATAGTGISISNPTGNITVTNSAPDQTVVLTDGTGISTTGTYPNFTITNTSPDQVVSLTNGGNIGISGTYPSFTLTNNGVVSVTGTANEIDVSAPSGAITLSLPATINADLNGNATTATTATSASTATTATNIAGGSAGSIPYQLASGSTSLLASGTGVLIGGTTPSYTTTPTLTGTNFSSIPNSALQNDSITIGSTGVILGATATTLGGLTSIALTQDPTTALQVTTKQYVDGLVASGIHFHTPVRVESTIALTATYNNGTAGVGATLTNSGTQAALVIDGISVAVNDRVLIYQQANAIQNGIYVVSNIGSGSTNWVLTRASDADTYVINSANGLSEGSTVFVQEGTTGAGETYTCNTSGTITFGTTNITFAQISSAQIYSAGTGLTLTGTQFSLSSPVATTLGGTGQSSYVVGDTLYYSGGSTLSKLAIGSNNQVMTSSGSAPQWVAQSTLSVGSATTATNLGNGAANQIPYQTAAGATGYIVAPTTASTSLSWNGSAFVWSAGGAGVTSVGATAPIASSGGSTPTISISQANTSTNGFLSSTDWNTFNNKGSVSSVAISGTNITVSGSPITTTGTITLSIPQAIATSSSVQFGSFGVGTAASGTTGEIRATNNVTAFYSSDQKFKTNVQNIQNAVGIVSYIGGKTFEWTDDYIKTHGGEDDYFLQKVDFGVIAQDVQTVFPQAVRQRSDGSLAVDYAKLSALAFAAIKELSSRLDKLENQ
jgi:hypothetical protein